SRNINFLAEVHCTMITVPFWLKYRIACIILSSAASWVSGMIWSQIVDAGQVDAKKVPHQQVENQKPQADTAKAIIVDGVVVSRSEYSAIWRMNEHRKRRGLQP